MHHEVGAWIGVARECSHDLAAWTRCAAARWFERVRKAPARRRCSEQGTVVERNSPRRVWAEVSMWRTIPRPTGTNICDPPKPPRSCTSRHRRFAAGRLRAGFRSFSPQVAIAGSLARRLSDCANSCTPKHAKPVREFLRDHHGERAGCEQGPRFPATHLFASRAVASGPSSPSQKSRSSVEEPSDQYNPRPSSGAASQLYEARGNSRFRKFQRER
jgi:hypothetical protein